MRRYAALLGLVLFAAVGCKRSTQVAISTTAEHPTSDAPMVVVARQAEEFFEKHVRPVLLEHCVACHGPQKQRGGLRLDSANAFRKGSDAGPVVNAEKPDESLLLKVISHDGTTKMPPKNKLPEAAIQSLTKWVRMGAPWPAESDVAQKPSKQHWAFQPVREPTIPRDGVSPVDAFIRARLEAANLKMSPRADRRTLIRRATFDLHGLPPTPEEVAAFEADKAPDAFAKLVNRLLDSPRYGERWGRHWLDVARYADTKGYVRLRENPNYLCAWTYRDYVIRAFNDDLPYDRFLREQLAADQLVSGDDKRPLAAMGFLTLGERFINNPHDIIDDRIDVVTRGLMGLTVSCARCHDHKFDPIPTADYYSLYGVFAGSMEPRVPPMIALPSDRAKHDAYLKELQIRTDRFDQYIADQYAKFTTNFRTRAADYLLAAHKEQIQPNFAPIMFLVDVNKDLNPAMLQRWARYLEQTRKKHHPVLAPWHALAANISDPLTDKSKPLNVVVLEALRREPRPRDLAEVAARYGELFKAADEAWAKTRKLAPTATRLENASWEEIRQLLYGEDAPPTFPLAEIEDYFFVDASLQNQFHEQQRHVVDWIGSPNAAPHALILTDAATIPQAHVFVRGNASNPGVAVPRRFLEVLSQDKRKPFEKGSGRLELANAIASKDNPLTARVMVNRVWMHHFGAGLVRTPGDFGLRGEPPTHSELLDYLAWRFMEDGWSLKKLHRLILLSDTYQQASSDNAKAREKDPENRLLWRANRRRLDWESLRDALLAVSGHLDGTMGGPSVELTKPPFATRRSVYGFVDRQHLPSVMRTFDFASPDVSSPQRHQTTVPQQALFLMNSPFMKEQVRRLAKRKELQEQRIDAVYRLLYGRPADADEITLGNKYLESPGQTPDNTLSRWEEYLQVLLLANEFMFVD